MKPCTVVCQVITARCSLTAKPVPGNHTRSLDMAQTSKICIAIRYLRHYQFSSVTLLTYLLIYRNDICTKLLNFQFCCYLSRLIMPMHQNDSCRMLSRDTRKASCVFWCQGYCTDHVRRTV